MDRSIGRKKAAALIAAVAAGVVFPSTASVAANADCRPETLFHIIGGNASKAGLTSDLEALKDAGFGGILFFHGQYGASNAWDGVEEQIPCLSGRWDDLVRHIGTECRRLGLSFKMQNCPGWSMSGGPWIAHTNAMRKIVYAKGCVDGAKPVPPMPIPYAYADADSDWRDVCYLAFPTPEGEADALNRVPPMIETNGNTRVFRYAEPVTVRTLELPSPRLMAGAYCYNPDILIVLEAKAQDGWRSVLDAACPQGNWQDYGRDASTLSLACEEETSKEWRLTLSSPHAIKLPFARLRSASRLDNWEALAAHTLRGQRKRPQPRQSAGAYIPRGAVRVVKPGDVLPESGRGWTVLRVGHVNMKKRNVAAPAESTGWECDKLDPRGIEAHFAGFIGRLAAGPLAGGLLGGMEVDSWECARQTWTWRMPEFWREATGRDVREIVPALFGYVIGSPEETWTVLRDWRALVSKLVTENYYRRMAELAHGKGLSVTYETAFGDVIPGDILEYWKWCDTPMCEFWHPVAPGREETTFPNFKPVKPCASAAHLYGKRRVSAEAFTSMTLSWDENFRDLKAAAVRHFARGVTHLAFHTFTHTPQTDGRIPGTSFGASIGTPFVRGQTWWSFVRPFTDWAAACCAFLERGNPGVDVLRYLGDEFDHKPDELEYFPEGFKCDYLNADVLFNRLDVKDGRFVLPDGTSYAVLWVPPSVFVLPQTQTRLDVLAAKGGRIVRGTANDAVRGLTPHIVNAKGLLWYRRVDGDRDCFFVAAEEGGFTGEATFNTLHGERRLPLRLAPFETRFLEFATDARERVPPVADAMNCVPPEELDAGWRLSFPPGWGAPESIVLERLVPWKDLPGASEEGRAFSGTATYTRTIELQADPERPLLLDLGEVRDFARVFVNGREVAALWSQPYRCDIAPFAHKGANDLRVEVTSTWFNRLAYDFGQPPEERKTWTVWDIPRFPPPCLKPNAALRVSGLLGPVRLERQGGSLANAAGLVPGDAAVVVMRRALRPSHVYTYHVEGLSKGGGLYAADFAKGEVRRLVDASEGVVLDAQVSYDGRQILFSWKRTMSEPFAIWRINADGTGLEKVIAGTCNNQNACWLPDGGIAFTSDRKPAFAYCWTSTSPVLYRADGDGGSVLRLSANYLTDFTPSVMRDGRILFSRWEYVDRPAIPIQSLWAIQPDGTGLSGVFGNRVLSPATFMFAHDVPGRAGVFLCIMTSHNGPCSGAVGLVDVTHGGNAQEAVRNLTPEVHVPPVEDGIRGNRVRGPYTTPYPVDGERYLVSKAGEIQLRRYDSPDARILLPPPGDGLGWYSPQPLAPRSKPAALRANVRVPGTGPFAEVILSDVYIGLEGHVKRGEIKRIAVVQEMEKDIRAETDKRQFGFQFPVVSCGATYAPKRVWGFAEVESDGSAHFLAPANAPVYFLPLDAEGRAVQRMRTFTHFMPGERQSCIGCHANRNYVSISPAQAGKSIAAQRSAARLVPPTWGSDNGFSFARTVQPVLTRHCVKCHSGADGAPEPELTGDRTDYFNVAYENLARKGTGAESGSDVRAYMKNFGKNPYTSWIPTFNGLEENILWITPKTWGSPVSRLSQIVASGHPGKDGKPRVSLTDDERLRIHLWIDLNVPYYGTSQSRQNDLRGCRRVLPKSILEVKADIEKRKGVKLPYQFYVRYDHPERNPWLKEGIAKGVFTGADDPDYKRLLGEIVKARPMLDLRNDVDFRDVMEGNGV